MTLPFSMDGIVVEVNLRKAALRLEGLAHVIIFSRERDGPRAGMALTGSRGSHDSCAEWAHSR